MKITRPMKGVAVENYSQLAGRYPWFGSVKLDGIRSLKLEGMVLSCSFKKIPNDSIRSKLLILPDGLDGEIVCPGSTFSETTSKVMSKEGTPDFRYAVFDRMVPGTSYGYVDRMAQLAALELPDWCDKIIGTQLNNEAELIAFETKLLEQGHEGIMLRSPHGPYKCGESTLKQGWLLKLKKFVDSEAEVIGMEELMVNGNAKEKNELGLSKRSTTKAGLVPGGMLGAFIVKDVKSGIEFSIGSGFDDAERVLIWNNQLAYLDRVMTYKYQPIGVKEKPRSPVFKGWRSREDM